MVSDLVTRLPVGYSVLSDAQAAAFVAAAGRFTTAAAPTSSDPRWVAKPIGLGPGFPIHRNRRRS